VVHADGQRHGDNLHERFEVKWINHQETYSLDGACTPQTEEYFSRLRRAEIGIHDHIAGAYLLRYAEETSRRKDNRHISNRDQLNTLAAIGLKHGKGVAFLSRAADSAASLNSRAAGLKSGARKKIWRASRSMRSSVPDKRPSGNWKHRSNAGSAGAIDRTGGTHDQTDEPADPGYCVLPKVSFRPVGHSMSARNSLPAISVLPEARERGYQRHTPTHGYRRHRFLELG
jgi:hypothetical protein